MKEKMIGLIHLQECDNRMKNVVSKKKEGPIKIKELEERFHAFEAKYNEEYNKFESLKKNRLKFEQEIKEVESKIEKSGIKLSNIKSNKEYGAVLKEIEDMQKEKSRLEDGILHFMEEIDAVEKKCEEDRNTLSGLKKQVEIDIEKIGIELDALEKESFNLKAEREKCLQEVDKELLKKYLFLQERMNGQAISPVIRGVCQICHMGLPPQKFNELMRGEALMTCPNCNRMIYWGGDECFLNMKGNQA